MLREQRSVLLVLLCGFAIVLVWSAHCEQPFVSPKKNRATHKPERTMWSRDLFRMCFR